MNYDDILDILESFSEDAIEYINNELQDNDYYMKLQKIYNNESKEVIQNSNENQIKKVLYMEATKNEIGCIREKRIYKQGVINCIKVLKLLKKI